MPEYEFQSQFLAELQPSSFLTMTLKDEVNADHHSSLPLEQLNEDLFIKILHYLLTSDKKNLRATSSILKARVEDNCEELLTWTAKSAEHLYKIQDDYIGTVKKIRLELISIKELELSRLTLNLIVSLNLCYINFDKDSFLQGVLQLSNLEKLYIEYVVVSEKGLICLLKLPGNKLKDLTLRNNKFTSFSGIELAESKLMFPHLEDLMLEFGKQLTKSSLVALLNLPGDNLKKLEILVSHSINFPTELIEESGQKYPLLHTLVVRCQRTWRVSGLNDLFSLPGHELKHLTLDALNLRDFTRFSPDIKFPKLQDLILHDIRGLSETSMKSFLGLPGDQLINLDLSGIDFLSLNPDMSFSGIYFPELRALNLEYCDGLYGNQFQYLLRVPGRKFNTLNLRHTGLDENGARNLCLEAIFDGERLSIST